METVAAEKPGGLRSTLAAMHAERCDGTKTALRAISRPLLSVDLRVRLAIGCGGCVAKIVSATIPKLPQYRGESSFATWFNRLTVNECLQHLRKLRKKQFATLDYDPIDHAPGHETMFEQRELMSTAMDRLEEELRTIFVLREVQQHTYAEIATFAPN